MSMIQAWHKIRETFLSSRKRGHASTVGGAAPEQTFPVTRDVAKCAQLLASLLSYAREITVSFPEPNGARVFGQRAEARRI
jgi:hypothetical protein